MLPKRLAAPIPNREMSVLHAPPPRANIRCVAVACKRETKWGSEEMPDEKGRAEETARAAWLLLCRLTLVAVVIFSCYRLRSVINTVLVAAVIAYVLDPMVEWLCTRPGFARFHAVLSLGPALRHEHLRRRQPTPTRTRRLQRHALRSYATLYVFLVSAVILWQGGKFVVAPFVAEFKEVTAQDPIQHKSKLQTHAESALTRYDSWASDSLKSDKLLGKIQRSNFGEMAQKFVVDTALKVLESMKDIVEIVLLPVLAFYFLIDGRELKHEFVALLPRPRIREASWILAEFNRIMRAFVLGQFVLCLIAGIVVGVGLAALRVPYPVTMGVLAGITRAIPIIGPIIGGIPIILLTLVSKGTGAALLVLGFFTLLHLVESKFIMPMLIGDRMELHPVVIILVLLIGGEIGALLIGGSLGGLMGMFFAAPVAALVRVIIRRYWLRLPGRLRSSLHVQEARNGH